MNRTPEEMREAFIANEGERVKRDRDQEALTRKRNLGRQTPIKQRSFKEKLNGEYLRGVKEGFLYMQERYEEPCCEECGVAGDKNTLDLDHILPRSKGGPHRPDNLRLICNHKHPSGNDCHGNKHGKPQWTREDA